MILNLYTGWILFLLGGIAGAISGLLFHKPDWLGGYPSWPRRMIRLGHISFFGIGLINILFYLSIQSLELPFDTLLSAWLLIIAGVAMPLVCYLSAYKPVYRHAFFIPAGSVIIALLLFVVELLKHKPAL